MKATVLTGLGIMLAGIGFRLYQNIKSQQNWVAPPRNKVLQLIINMRQKLYPSLLEVCQLVQYQLKNNKSLSQSPDAMSQIKDLILSDDCPTGMRIKQIMEELHSEIDKDDFKKAVQETYINDPQIQFHKRAFQEQFHKSFLGVQPAIKTQMPTYLTEQKVMSLIKKLLKQKIQRIASFYNQNRYLTEDFFIEDSQVDHKLRTEQLRKLGLKESKNPTQIFEFCVAKYLQMNQKFKKQYQQTIKQYRQKLQKYNK